MEPPAARECVGLADDLPACLCDLRFDRVELDRVHHDEWIGRPHGRVLREAAAQAPILEARVVGSVILESPAEHLLIEFPGPAHIGRTELDVVDPPVLVALRHPNLPLPRKTLRSNHHSSPRNVQDSTRYPICIVRAAGDDRNLPRSPPGSSARCPDDPGTSCLTSPGPPASLHRALYVKAGLGQCAGPAFRFFPSRGRTDGEGRSDRDQWHRRAGAAEHDVPRPARERPLRARDHCGQDAALPYPGARGRSGHARGVPLRPHARAYHLPVQVNRALARTGLVKDGGPPRCPHCTQRLAFGSDRLGRTTESCGCGYEAYVQVRESERAAPAVVSGGPAPAASENAEGLSSSVAPGSKRAV